MKSWLKNNVFVFFLLSIILFIAYQAYGKGTFLSGWDTLHPEFNFDLNFKRMLFGVWRQEQGLGAVAAHTHMSDLPRVFILWLFHFIAPLNLLRYIYMFICLVAGPIGMYFFTRYLLLKHKPEGRFVSAVAFISGLYYLLNFSTVQQFYVPFEMFPTQYAFLPWVLLFSFQFYTNGREKKALFLFALVTLLGAPQAYAAHLWYPFFGVFCLTLLLLVIYDRFSLNAVKKSVILIFFTIAVNSFWLFPNIYYIVTQSGTPIASKQNRLSSQEYQLKNRENGYLSDVALVKGFYFSWDAYDYNLKKIMPLMPEWIHYIEQPYVKFIGYFLFAGGAFGLFFALLKKSKFFIALSPFLLCPFVLLMNHTPPFEYVFNALNSIRLFEEALRFVFTKLSILLIFGYCLYFAFFISLVCEILHSKKYRTLLYSFLGILFMMLMFYVHPIFNGSLISSRMKITIPQEYFELWDYMKDQKDGTILPLPLNSFSGWQYYNFGYQGAGFIWFGLKQPILDRDSDRWNIKNEQAFNEFHNAVYSQSADQLSAVLKKYNIQYILWDKNIISPEQKNQDQLLFVNESESLINRLIDGNILTLQKSFSSHLFVYKVNRLIDETEIIQINTNILPTYEKNYRDFAYMENGDYMSTQFTNNINYPTRYYPFRNILNENESLNLNTISVNTQSDLHFNRGNLNTYFQDISIPNLSDTENIVSASINVKKIASLQHQYNLKITPNLPKIITNPILFNMKLDTDILQISDSFLFPRDPVTIGSEDWSTSLFLKTREPNSVNNFKFIPENRMGNLSIMQTEDLKTPVELLPIKTEIPITYDDNSLPIPENGLPKEITLQSFDSNSLIVFPLPNIPHNVGYVIAIESKYSEGLPLRICMKNIYSGLCDIYTDIAKNTEYKTEYFLIPPTDENIGYRLEITSYSLGNYPSISNLKQVNIFPIQYNYLSSIYYFNKEDNKANILQEKKYQIAQDFLLPYFKSIQIDIVLSQSQSNNIVVLNQAYHDGWKLYQMNCQSQTVLCKLMSSFPFLFGRELNKHVLVNNWSNGWMIDDSNLKDDGVSKKIVVMFLPQYLEYIGFVILILTFVIILVKKSHKHHSHHIIN